MEPITDYSRVLSNIHRELSSYLTAYPQLKSLVVGISGGIDSGLTAALASRVTREKGLKLIGRSITIASNKPEEIARARAVGDNFIDDFREADLTDHLEAVARTVMEDYDTADPTETKFKIRLGNVKARIRMLYLYDQAGKNSGMVLSTDNLTEMLLGFWTLHGDVGDFGILQNLWKSEVYKLAETLAQELPQKQAEALSACIDAVPTDGLGITDTDLDQIGGSSYAQVDKILQALTEGSDPGNDEVAQKVRKRHKNSAYKRNNPYNIPRKQIVK